MSKVRGGAVHELTDEWKSMGRSAFGMLFKQSITVYEICYAVESTKVFYSG